jgi:hypothetical protein
MWCKIMENVAEPTKVYEFTEAELVGCYYQMTSPNYTVVEMTKKISLTNLLEKCALDLASKEIQVQIYSGTELIRAVTSKFSSYMIFEVEGQPLERLQLEVKSIL